MDDLPVAELCRALQVSVGGYDAWERRPPSARKQANVRLVAVIAATHHELRERRGSRGRRRELRRRNLDCCAGERLSLCAVASRSITRYAHCHSFACPQIVPISDSRNRERDRRSIRELREAGWRVAIVWGVRAQAGPGERGTDPDSVAAQRKQRTGSLSRRREP